MENQKNFLPVAFQYGIILAISRILVDVGLRIFDVSATVYYTGYFIGFILEIVLIFMAVKFFRDKVNEGLLSFGEAIKIGIVMMIITGIATFISFSFINPEFQAEKVIEFAEKYDPKNIDLVIERTETGKKNPNYFLSFGIFLMYYIFLGFVISAIAGAILGRRKEQY